ncbi:phosphatase PAP2 family protein [Halomarina litorea]|uniref:phosphatase PAP2 family protein n=1 Tax=Halomarina litorea TaxID=2961595 RepID=UPI0020C4AC7A|nr:phosphatase PAP2 family protein [Halomarina sp. BCD28]
MQAIGRSLGVTEFIEAMFTGNWEVVFAALTQLGDIWFLFLMGATVYAASARIEGVDRRQGAFVLALALFYVATVQALKGVFTLPRPTNAAVAPVVEWIPQVLVPVFENTATATGYGFPSGHALGTTLVWGGVALALDYGTRRSRLFVAGTVAALVSVSRLALGVHFLVDVLAGAALGAALLAALYRLADGGRVPDRVLLAALAVGVLGVLNTVAFDSVSALGATLGGWLSWRLLVDERPTPSSETGVLAVSAAVFLFAGVGFAVVYFSEPGLPAGFVGSFLAAGAIVGAPDIAGRVVRTVGTGTARAT